MWEVEYTHEFEVWWETLTLEQQEAIDDRVSVLFAFDPRRHAILLLGGDKSGDWESWYTTAVPEADDLYDTHLQELRDEGLIDG